MISPRTGLRSSSRHVVPRVRYFFAALSFLWFRFSVILVFAFLVYILYCQGDAPQWTYYGIGGAVLTMIVSGTNLLVNRSVVSCPLCRASLFMSPRNHTKPHVRKICGCAKTPLALSMLTTPRVMTCPSCGERVKLVRD